MSHLWGRSLSEDDWYEPCRQWAGLRLLSPLLTFTLTWTEHSSPSKGAIKIACSRFHHHKPFTARGNNLLPSTICMQIIVPLSVRSVCVGWWVVSYYDQSAELCRNWLPLSFTLKISVYLWIFHTGKVIPSMHPWQLGAAHSLLAVSGYYNFLISVRQLVN